jgi:hypothetical protein
VPICNGELSVIGARRSRGTAHLKLTLCILLCKICEFHKKAKAAIFRIVRNYSRKVALIESFGRFSKLSE